MTRLWLALTIVVLAAHGLERPPPPMLCMGAQLAIVLNTAAKLQERHTPPGEWCQRPAPTMSKKAHPCDCHKHDCEDPDPDHLSAHTDPKCDNYCNTKDCRCAVHDCL